MTDILPPPDQSAAATLSTEIEELLGQISAHELRLSHSYARLGSLLWKVKTEQHWITWGFNRFSSYIEFVWNKIGRQRSQVYAILSVAESLLPYISEEKLEEIGITKSHELRRLVKGGLRPDAFTNIEISDPTDGLNQRPGGRCFTTVQIMDYAADPKVTAAQLRVKVNELLHLTEAPQGLWYEFSGFYATAEERKEITQFWEWGRTVLELTSESEHEWKKQVFLAAVRECLSSWAEVANDPLRSLGDV